MSKIRIQAANDKYLFPMRRPLIQKGHLKNLIKELIKIKGIIIHNDKNESNNINRWYDIYKFGKQCHDEKMRTSMCGMIDLCPIKRGFNVQLL